MWVWLSRLIRSHAPLSVMEGSLVNFQWPWQYNFPPFFSIQQNRDTRQKQLEAWCDLVLNYHKTSKSYVFDLNESYSGPLFNNERIKRKLSVEGINLVLEALEARGNIEWQDKQKSRCLVMWRSPREWGQLILQWAKNNGLENSVCTFYEIHSGEDSADEEFYGIENWLLKKAIISLSEDGLAELIGSSDGSDSGVKFFS